MRKIGSTVYYSPSAITLKDFFLVITLRCLDIGPGFKIYKRKKTLFLE